MSEEDDDTCDHGDTWEIGLVDGATEVACQLCEEIWLIEEVK